MALLFLVQKLLHKYHLNSPESIYYSDYHHYA